MNVNELKALIRELIKTELGEVNTTGTGTTISTGSSEALLPPSLLEKKEKKQKIEALNNPSALDIYP